MAAGTASTARADTQQWLQHDGVVVRGVVEDDHHALAWTAVPQELPQECREGFGIEHTAELSDEAPRLQADGPEAGHGLARGSV